MQFTFETLDFLLDLMHAMKMMTAMMTVATMAALAGMMIQSSFWLAPTPSVRISRHCSNGTDDGVISWSSIDTMHTTMHSCKIG